MLARDGKIDLDGPLWDWLPELPPWGVHVTIRHLVHHEGGLPFDVDVHEPDRTTHGVLHSLSRFLHLPHLAGAHFDYSNPGYVCLGEIISRASGVPMQDYARTKIFQPLGMRHTCFWPGPAPAPPDAVELDPPRPAPLSLGDGGMWSTADDLLRWCEALNDDRLGISAQLQKPGVLDNGETLEYAWGMGVHEHRGHTFYRHGGAWAGVRSLLVRVPEQGVGVVVLALGDDTERRIALTDALLDKVLPRAPR
jgi:CubicO group peptidase (beta-lactamase class C family)